MAGSGAAAVDFRAKNGRHIPLRAAPSCTSPLKFEGLMHDAAHDGGAEELPQEPILSRSHSLAVHSSPSLSHTLVLASAAVHPWLD